MRSLSLFLKNNNAKKSLENSIAAFFYYDTYTEIETVYFSKVNVPYAKFRVVPPNRHWDIVSQKLCKKSMTSFPSKKTACKLIE